MAAVCAISLGAYFRELNAVERRYAGVVCGDAEALQAALAPLPARLHAPEQAAVPGRGEGTRY